MSQRLSYSSCSIVVRIIVVFYRANARLLCFCYYYYNNNNLWLMISNCKLVSRCVMWFCVVTDVGGIFCLSGLRCGHTRTSGPHFASCQSSQWRLFDSYLLTRVNNGTQPPADSDSYKHKMWDKVVVDAEYYRDLLSRYSEPYHRARLLVAAAPHSSDWLQTLPISASGLRLENNAVRVAVGLRTSQSGADLHRVWKKEASSFSIISLALLDRFL